VTAISAPLHNGFLGGLSTTFSLGAAHKLEEGAVKREIVALHITLGHGSTPSVSTEIAALRTLILHPPNGEAEYWIRQLSKVCCVTYKPGCEIVFINFPWQGKIPLVVRTNSADIITTVLRLKEELELELNHPLKVTILGGAEAHLLANELAKADVGVVLMPPRPYVSDINLFSIPQ
jgi:hypothetical protein